MDDYGRFMQSVSGESLEWREEIAVDSFLRLEGGQRANAEKVLIRQLTAVDDCRIPSALKEEGEDGPIWALITLKAINPAEVPDGILAEIEHAALTHPAGNVRCSAAAALLFVTRVSTFAHFEHRPLILSFHQALETRRQSMLEIKKMIAAAGN